jgi:hypothetical protein
MGRRTGTLSTISMGVVLCAATIAGCSSEGSTSSYSEDASEYQLASLAKGGPATDAEVRPFEIALDAAVPLCLEGRSLIGDMAFTGQGVASEQGVQTTTLELLKAIPEAVPAEIAPTACADVIAAIITLMS